MMQREILCDSAIDYEYQPDGGKTPIIDPYDGCQLNCPYCFQWNDRAWNKAILIKTNLPAVLAEELDTWDHAEPIYVGSRGDPYQPRENTYGLTRRTLEVIRDHAIPCYLNTKSDSQAFRRDFELFATFGEQLIVCMGQANLPHLRAVRHPSQLPNILAAQELARRGIAVWVFITPALPGITDVHAMIAALPESVPVFLDKVRLSADDPPGVRFLDYVRRAFPELESRYRAMIATGTDPYYAELREHYRDNPRVKFVFGDA